MNYIMIFETPRQRSSAYGTSNAPWLVTIANNIDGLVTLFQGVNSFALISNLAIYLYKSVFISPWKQKLVSGASRKMIDLVWFLTTANDLSNKAIQGKVKLVDPIKMKVVVQPMQV